MREEQDIEFKKEWRNEHLKTIAGFANTEGGVMCIDIDDNGRAVTLSNIKKLLEDIPNKENKGTVLCLTISHWY